jgi:hypothetical protein
MLTGRLFGGTPRMDAPPIRTSPSSGAMKPATMRSSVVLPQPDGPRIEKKLPCATESDSESTAAVRAIALADAIDLEVLLQSQATRLSSKQGERAEYAKARSEPRDST